MVYVLVLQYAVHDQQMYEDFADKMIPVIEQYGGVVSAIDDNVTAAESKWMPRRTVVLTFPSAERAHAWHRSPEYRAIVHLRRQSMTSEMVFVHGVNESSSMAVH